MKIYVASSWRNYGQPSLVHSLRGLGHEVYDFRNPPNGSGFGWEEVMEGYVPGSEDVSIESYLSCLDHPRAEEGFASDMDALKTADACVLILPCGKSAHLELGWAVGAGKLTAILLGPGQNMQPELMYKMVDYIAPTAHHLMVWLADPDRSSQHIPL